MWVSEPEGGVQIVGDVVVMGVLKLTLYRNRY